MEKDDKGSTLIRIGVSGWKFLLVPAYPGCPGSKAVKRSLLYRIIDICISVGGQLDGNVFPGSLPHKFISFVTLIISFVVNKFLFLSLPRFIKNYSPARSSQSYDSNRRHFVLWRLVVARIRAIQLNRMVQETRSTPWGRKKEPNFFCVHLF